MPHLETRAASAEERIGGEDNLTYVSDASNPSLTCDDSFRVPIDSSHRFEIPTTPDGATTPRTPEESCAIAARLALTPPLGPAMSPCVASEFETSYAISHSALPSEASALSPRSSSPPKRQSEHLNGAVLCERRYTWHDARNEPSSPRVGPSPRLRSPTAPLPCSSQAKQKRPSSRTQNHPPLQLPMHADTPSPYLSENSSQSSMYKSVKRRSSRDSGRKGSKFRSQGCVELHNTRDQRSLSGLMKALDFDTRVSATATSLDGGMKDSDLGSISGIHVTTLIECCAANFRSSATDTHSSRSASRFPVDQLDDFISHSWRASRWLKYFALVLIYNNEAALLMCAMSAIITYLLWGHLPSISDESPIKSYCCAVGFMVYFFGVQCYQRIRQLFRLRLNTAFLDKLCIDQTDEESMRNGIRRLSLFLVNSRRMVILWDRTYFTRAWCVFEVAVREHFFKVHGCSDNTNIVLVPLQLACIVSMLCISVWVSCAALLVCLNLEVDDLVSLRRLTTMGIAIISSLICGSCAAKIGRQYARDKRHLKDTLLQFSWDRAQCHDPQDYEAISMLLLHWFGSIWEFEEYVCGEFRQRVIRQLGGKDGLRIKFTLPVCMAVFCCILDFVAYTTHIEPRNTIGHVSLWIFFFTASFSVVPLVFKLFLRLCGLLQLERESWLEDACVNMLVWLVTLLCIVPTIGLPAILDRLYFSRREIGWFALQIIVDIALAVTCAWNYKDSVQHAVSATLAQFRRCGEEGRSSKTLPPAEFSLSTGGESDPVASDNSCEEEA